MEVREESGRTATPEEENGASTSACAMNDPRE